MKYLDLLGYKVTDRVTGYSGVVESISYDLYGCIQPLVVAAVDEKGKLEQGRWFDGGRLEKSGVEPVVPVPSFGHSFGHEQHHLMLLGWLVSDSVTGFQGVVEAVNFDLKGCVDVALRPPVDKENKLENSHWFHVSRVITRASSPVMSPPLGFADDDGDEDKGAAEKPAR